MQGPTDIAVKAWSRLVRAHGAAMGGIEADLKRAGLPPLAWYDVLLALARSPEGRLAPRQIEERTLLAQYNLSRLLDRMETDGFVRRLPYPGDRRRQLVAITAEGEAMQARMWPVYGAGISRQVGERLTPAETEALAGLLRRLLPRGD
jgi:DNA-binding MarR family transcriptional regulator